MLLVVVGIGVLGGLPFDWGERCRLRNDVVFLFRQRRFHRRAHQATSRASKPGKGS
ncbi:hypothetical protein NORO109296_05830 [Nocardiopsis rhodophaea]